TAEMGLLEIRIFNVLLLYTLTLDFIYSSGLLQRAREVREKSALVFRGRLKPALASLGVRIELPPLDAARKRFAAIRYELPAAMGLFRRYRFYLDELKRRGIVRWRMK
nr:hypothetical protein [Spirochaetota bacterium]